MSERMIRRSTMSNIDKTPLPNEYKQMFYLQPVSKGAYIDPNIMCSSNFMVEVTYEYNILTNSDFDAVCGYDYGNNHQFTITNYWNNASKGYSRSFASQSGERAVVNFAIEGIHNSVLHNGYTFTDGIIAYNNMNEPTIENKKFLIFCSNSNGTPNKFSIVKIYGIKIYSFNILERHLIPCYRISDNIAGMYDIVNNVFYTNAGTSRFHVI